jgi:hypothetical protein
VRAALAITLLAVAAAVAAAAPNRPRKRPGKTVRVERKQPAVASTSRLCPLYDRDVGSCPREVAVGDVGLVVDAEGTYGEATIAEVTRINDTCGNPVTWNIVIDVSRLAPSDFSYNALLVMEHRVADGGQTVAASMDAPSGRPDENVQHALDDDGDGQPDLLVTSYACDERLKPSRASRVSHTCYDTWLEVRDEWRRARTDQVPMCYR